ncbi:Phospholipase D beta 2 [Cocos nucifera]|uniref:phospholipase D n=1 Tax=Cocos nucifera TaxID=13894 RepID=A0A8K0N8X1_COCNU|nr:Phospholipase D beta 2 [Cocos nucifera]
MDNYGNPYPNPYGYLPPPNPDPYHYRPPRYLHPSNSFPSPPMNPDPQFNHSGPLDYPPPAFPPASLSSSSPSYDPYYNPEPNPYPYPLPHPYPAPYHSMPYDSDPNSPSLHHAGSSRYEPTAPPAPPYSYPPSRSDSFSSHSFPPDDPSLSTPPSLNHSPSTSSMYPLNDLLANIRLSDQPPDLPSISGSHHRPSMSFSGSFPQAPPSFSPQTSFSSPLAPYGGSHHGQNLQLVPYDNTGGLKASLKVLLLHGSLDVWVCEARNLPNMDMFSKTLGDMFGKRLTSSLSSKMEHLPSMTSDPYVSITVCGAVVGRTYVVSNSENPDWMQHFNVPVAHHAAEVEFVVKDSDIVGAQLIGTVSIPVESIYSGQRVEGTYPIIGPNGKPCKPGAVLRLAIQYIPIERLSMFHNGVGAGPDYRGVPGTYFPLRKGNKVTLYQDAHVPDGCLPDLRLDHGMHYVHGKCWRDIFDSISQARHLVYITGWSVFHTVHLVRDASYGSDCTLGDLLKTKSQEGVRVLLLVWDDPTSRSILGYQTDGLMGTRDEETRRFFKHSSVQVLLCPRSAGKRHSWVKQQETGTIYTHHQKTVIVDADAANNKRKIIAFIGGLDLCGGRYDTPRHYLFGTLQTLHKDDYHQPNFAILFPTSICTGIPQTPQPVKDASRMPISVPDSHLLQFVSQMWLECGLAQFTPNMRKIDGPAAYDILTNFEERWLKASKRHGIKKLKRSSDDALLRIERIPYVIGIQDLPYLKDDDPESWHVQVFRSIDSNSVKGFPKDPRSATTKNLVCGKNVLIDMSIHTAYVNAIRAAQHFIYIENQYFLGSSFNWDSNKDLGANNLIPIEIALKIANKIKANERFSAYIVIPMWPEGNPTGAATQRILYWQALAKKNRRFMIYVHSKGMIVDDEYVILGSANINQRSMEGTRDTEIAMGAYQPQHTWARKLSGPRGQIYGYRMSLWAEHAGTLEECFTCPESLECMRRVRDMGEQNWKQYVADEITEMKGHLLKYPVSVDRKGKVKPLPGCDTFPDMGGNICGSFIAIQENLTI